MHTHPHPCLSSAEPGTLPLDFAPCLRLWQVASGAPGMPRRVCPEAESGRHCNFAVAAQTLKPASISCGVQPPQQPLAPIP